MTHPLLDGHEAGELTQDGKLFAQADDKLLQLRLLSLQKHQELAELLGTSAGFWDVCLCSPRAGLHPRPGSRPRSP